ncbi:MAG: sirohydrochlorin chelatase, partial [Planctomycetota bacterium]
VPEDRKGAGAAAFLAKHPELADFVGDPQNALLAVEVSDYHLVRQFQDVVRIHMGQAGDVPGRERQKKATMCGAALVLLAHGSRDPAWRSWFEQLASSLDVSLGRGRVRAAYLQFSSPTLLEAVTSAAEEGFRQIAVLPVFISAGGHVMKDVPAQVAAVEEQWSSLEITILPRIGEYKEFEQLVRQIVQKAIGSSNTRFTDQGPGLP